MAEISNSFIKFDYIKFLLKKNKRFIILMLITMIIFNPILVSLVGLLNEMSSSLLNIGKIFNLLLALVSCFIVSSILFSYLNNKKSLDVYHALPIKRETLHLTIYIGGLIILLIPFTISWALALPLNLFINGSNILSDLSGYIFAIIPIVTVYSFIIFVQINTGTTVDSMLYSLLVLFLPFFTYTCFYAYASTLLLGYNSTFDWSLLKYLSPIVSLFTNTINHEVISSKLIINNVYWLFITVILYIITIIIYRKRPTEQAQKPFTNKYFFPLVSISSIALLQILLYALFYEVTYSETSLNISSLILSILIADVLYIILDTLANRSFKNILKAALLYFLISIIVIIMIIPINITRGFGYVDKVPTNIKSVTIAYEDNLDLMFTQYKTDFYFYQDSYQTNLTFTDPNDINVITNLHHLIINNYDYFNDNKNNLSNNFEKIDKEYNLNTFDKFDYNALTYITFDYVLNDGTSLARSYTINYNWLASLIKLNNTDSMMSLSIPMAYYHDKVDTIDTVTLSDKLLTTETDITDRFDLDAFASAYLIDYANINYQDHLSTNYTYYGKLSANMCKYTSEESTYCTTDYLDIDSRYPYTLAYLNSIDAKFPTTDYDKIARIVFPSDYFDYYIFHVAGVRYFNDYDSDHIYNYVELTSEQLETITPYLIPNGVSEKQTMLLTTSDNYYYIYYLVDPDHYQDVMNILSDNPIKQGTQINEILYDYQSD